MLIEDVACPVDKLGDMTQDLVDMFQKFGYKDASCFGHALEGNLHLVFSQVRLLCTPSICCFTTCNAYLLCLPCLPMCYILDVAVGQVTKLYIYCCFPIAPICVTTVAVIASGVP